MNTGGDTQVIDWLSKSKITPLPLEDASLFKTAAYLLDKERNVGRMANDSSLQIERRGGGPQNSIQHGPAGTLIERPQCDVFGVASVDPIRGSIWPAGDEYQQVEGLQRCKGSHDGVACAVDPVQILNKKHCALLVGQILYHRAACLADSAAA